jgi:hypothetical protein
VKLHHTFPTPDGTRAVCIWAADTVETLQNLLEPMVGKSAATSTSLSRIGRRSRSHPVFPGRPLRVLESHNSGAGVEPGGADPGLSASVLAGVSLDVAQCRSIQLSRLKPALPLLGGLGSRIFRVKPRMPGMCVRRL